MNEKCSDSRGVSQVGEKMKTQAISMQTASNSVFNNTRTVNRGNNFNGRTFVAVQTYPRQDSFGTWAAKNIITGAAFSAIWDVGTNLVAQFNKKVDAIPVKQMFKNAPKVAGIFLLMGGIFRLVNNAIDRN